MDRDEPAHSFLKKVMINYPYIQQENANLILRKLLTIKQLCEMEGMKMADVDKLARRYNFEQLKEAGVCKSFEEIGTYMWHGGAHHVGYDCHDMVQKPEIIAPNMVFCVDIGIYHEEWGIGFRIEDNCLVTETGCENLSYMTPRTVDEIEDTMRKHYK